MRILMYINHRPRELRIARALKAGIEAHGDELEIRSKADYGKFRKFEGPDPNADLTLAYGVKSADLLREHQVAGVPWGIIDKGYIRRSGPHGVEMWSRISINETYPLSRIMRPRPHDRWDILQREAGVGLDPFRENGGEVLLAGSSQKFYSYFGAGEEGRFHSKLIRRLKKENRPDVLDVTFRPKPSYEKRMRKEDVLHSYGAHHVSLPDGKGGESIKTALGRARVLVTFASNAACDAILAGVPAVVLGPHVSRPVAGSDLNLADLHWPKDGVRFQWASSLAYEQWTLDEMASGEAWGHLRDRPATVKLADEWWAFKHQEWGWEDAD